jgi:hypothetical protein
MPIFKKKKGALGIDRKLGVTKVYDALSGKTHVVGGINKGPMTVSGSRNPKIRSLREKEAAQLKLLSDSLKTLKKTKPKNSADALKIKEAIEKINSKKIELTRKFNAKVSEIKTQRDTKRASKQADALFINLYGLAFPKSLNNQLNRYALSIDPKFVREAYKEYVHKNFDAKNFSFTKLTQKDATLILDIALQKTAVERKEFSKKYPRPKSQII